LTRCPMSARNQSTSRPDRLALPLLRRWERSVGQPMFLSTAGDDHKDCDRHTFSALDTYVRELTGIDVGGGERTMKNWPRPGDKSHVIETRGLPDGYEPAPLGISSPPRTICEADKARLQATARTLRSVATWLGDDKERATLVTVAEEVESATEDSLGDVCPVCQEVLCDDDCPLEPVRRGLN
jgi:hypothetical protein